MVDMDVNLFCKYNSFFCFSICAHLVLLNEQADGETAVVYNS